MKGQMNIFKEFKSKTKAPDKVIPEGVKIKLGMLWCPYCSTIVKFVRDNYLGVKKCPYCRISDSDYYVNKINKTWK